MANILTVNYVPLSVFRDRVIVNRFAWPKVTKVSYNESRFILKLRRSPGERSDTSVAFKMCDRKEASRFWKTCIEHHCFFRFATNEQVKPSWFQILLGRRNFGSRYKYVGRTMLEVRDRLNLFIAVVIYYFIKGSTCPAETTRGAKGRRRRRLQIGR